MIGCLRTRVRKQPIIALYFESENELKFYNLKAWKAHNHRLQANPWQQEEGKENTDSHTTARKQLKKHNQPYLPHQDDCKTR